MAVYPDKKGRGQPTGRFRVEVQLGGKRMRGRFDTLEEARHAEVEWKRKLAVGDTSGATVREDARGAPKTLSALLGKAAPLIWNGSTHGEDARGKVERIITWLGDRRLSKVDTGLIDDLILRLRQEGRSPATVNRYLSALHVVLDWGHAKGRAYVPDMPEFTWQDEDEGRIRYLSLDEERTLCETLEKLGQAQMAVFVRVAIDTGCRRSELLGAKGGQLDGSWLRLWRTKNGHARSVPLTLRAQALLEANLPWTFSDAQLRYWWDKAKGVMGLPRDDDFCVHALRHTCATRLVARGVNLRVIQTYMGHRSINTTLRYAHVSDDLLSEAAAKLQSQADCIRARKEVGAEQVGYAPRLAVLAGGGVSEKSAGEQPSRKENELAG